MFDARIRQHIDPGLNRAGAALARRGVSAQSVTLSGLGLGLLAALLVALGHTYWALVFVILSRLADGLDGAVARASETTDFGGYLDILADFTFYGAMPMGFVLLDPAANAVAGAFLLLAFFVNGSSFLGFAIVAEKRRLGTDAQGAKNLYYSSGLIEGSETIGFLMLACLLPAAFPPLALLMGTLCLLTALQRVLWARQLLNSPPEN
jgi:phosphatidylglycerophosphate synthase